MHSRRICTRTFYEAKLGVARRQVHLSHLVPDAKEGLLDDMSFMDAHSHAYTYTHIYLFIYFKSVLATFLQSTSQHVSEI